MPPPTRLVTAALPYCNSEPHLGNLIGSTLSADVFARYSRACHYPTLYICGTDRFGTATEIKALEEKLTPREICTKYHALHEKIYKFFQIQFDYFGSTDTPLHTQITHEVIQGLEEHSCLLIKPTSTCMCTTCHRALSDRFVSGECPNCHALDARGDQCDSCGHLTHATTLLNPRCTLCRNATLEFQVSPHQFLKFDQTQSKVKRWITNPDGALQSTKTEPHAFALTLSKLEGPLPAKDITRNLSWGVAVPERFGLKDQVYYVWFEATVRIIALKCIYFVVLYNLFIFISFFADWVHFHYGQRRAPLASTVDRSPDPIVPFHWQGQHSVPYDLFPSHIDRIGTGLDSSSLHLGHPLSHVRRTKILQKSKRGCVWYGCHEQ